MYSLTIMRYGRTENFDTLDELREEVSRYFPVSEQGTVDKLCTFHGKPNEYGFYKNDYQDMRTLYYPDWVD